MRGIWAVARYTFSQCLRMKVAVLFILLLALTLATMALGEDPYKTLADRIRTFLSYSTSLTSFLLSVVTVVLAVSVVSSDVRDKQIFTVATKPLSRWQYILGRWLGVVLLGGILLAGSATAQPSFWQASSSATSNAFFSALSLVKPSHVGFPRVPMGALVAE